ncbi:hypothetical protein [Ancylomarina sp.]|uniref:AbiTii domain-containing protein n=1 Tax=Ancylomarina sp. TaxID=1970196 RepID=UPI003564C59A
MIKQLIEDIAFDRIKLSQALTRAKIVENKIKNKNFKKWLKKELEGYDFNDSLLPKYRKIWCPIYLNAEFPFGRSQRFPVIMPDNTEEEILNTINFHIVTEPISIVEEQMNIFKDAKGYIKTSPHQVEILAELYQSQVEGQGGVIRSGSREVGKAQYQEIVELTKQNLLDTLMDLENEFPNLINEYVMTKENDDKVKNIITNNIYGSNNPMNIAAGQNVEQSGNTITISAEDIEQLESFGVEPDQIKELKSIVAENSADKGNLKSKVMGWLGSVSASVAARGLYDKIPAITDFVQTII